MIGQHSRRQNNRISRKTGISLLSIMSIIGVVQSAPNVGSKKVARGLIEEEYQGCFDDLLLADNDGDLQLTSDEYLEFITLRSGGRLEYSEFSEMPISFVATFNLGACFCSFYSTDSQCCVGDKANINLDLDTSDMIEDSLYTICRLVDEDVQSLLPDTPAPTKAPVDEPTLSPTKAPVDAPTSSPTKAPVDAPTLSPTKAPVDEPTLSPTKAPVDEPTLSPTRAPVDEPTSSPTRAPVDEPTSSPTKAPVDAPTSSPTKAPVDEPTISPTRLPIESTDAPTTEPSLPPVEATDPPTKPPTLTPTRSPTNAPTRAPVLITEEPSATPTMSPTRSPSDSPTLSPVATSDEPSAIPSMLPTTSPSDSPTLSPIATSDEPSAIPSMSPSRSPSDSPTFSPDATSDEPSAMPTFAPVAPTSRPTATNELCISFQYGIVNNGGFNASDIYNMVNNTLKTGLIIAAANITIDVLNTSFPVNRQHLRFKNQRVSHDGSVTGNRNFEARSQQKGPLIVSLDFFESQFPPGFVVLESPGGQRALAYLPQGMTMTSDALSQLARRLVQYLESVPPEITQILDTRYCPSDTPDVTKCAIVTSSVCVFLDEGDNRPQVRSVLTAGIQAAIMNGDFEAAIPEEHRIP